MLSTEVIGKTQQASHIENQAFWKKHLEQFALSKTSRANYCRNQKLNYARFQYWYHQLNSAIKKHKQPLIPVKIATLETQPTLLCSVNLKSGHQLRVYDRSVLSELLKQFS